MTITSTESVTVHDEEGLDALPSGTILRDRDGDHFEKDYDDSFDGTLGSEFYRDFTNGDMLECGPLAVVNTEILGGIPEADPVMEEALADWERELLGYVADSTFSVGDRVRCVDASAYTHHGIEAGMLGTVTGTKKSGEPKRNGFLQVKFDAVDTREFSMFGSRFESAPAYTVGQPVRMVTNRGQGSCHNLLAGTIAVVQRAYDSKFIVLGVAHPDDHRTGLITQIVRHGDIEAIDLEAEVW